MNTGLIKFIVKNALHNLTYQVRDYYDGYREIDVEDDDLDEFAKKILNLENIKELTIGIVTPLSQEFELKRKDLLKSYPLSKFWWVKNINDLRGRKFDKLIYGFKHEYMDGDFLDQCKIISQ